MNFAYYLHNKNILTLKKPNFRALIRSSDLYNDTLGRGFDALSIALMQKEVLPKFVWEALITQSNPSRTHAHGNNLMLMLEGNIQHLDLLLANTHFTAQNSQGLNALMLVYEKNIILTDKQMDKLFYSTDLAQTDAKGEQLLYYILKSNLPKNKSFIDKIMPIESYSDALYIELINNYELLELTDISLENCNPLYQNYAGHNILTAALTGNLQLKYKQFDYLIKKCDLKQQTKKGWNALTSCFRCNTERNINLSEEHKIILLSECDLKQQNEHGWNALMLAFRCNDEQKLNLTEQEWDILIDGSDLNQTNNKGWNALMFALRYNSEQKVNLTELQFDRLIYGSDLKQINNKGDNSLVLAFRQSKTQKLTDKQYNFLIKNSNLKQIGEVGIDILTTAIVHNEFLNLHSESFDFLIKNSNLRHYSRDDDKWNAFVWAVVAGESQKLNLTSEQISYMAKRSDLCYEVLLNHHLDLRDDIVIKIIKSGALKLADSAKHKELLTHKNKRISRCAAKQGNPELYWDILQYVKDTPTFNIAFQLATKNSDNIINFLILPKISKAQVESLLKYPLTSYTKTQTCLTMCLNLGLDIEKAVRDGFSSEALIEKNLSLLGEKDLDKIYPYMKQEVIEQSAYLQKLHLSRNIKNSLIPETFKI